MRLLIKYESAISIYMRCKEKLLSGTKKNPQHINAKQNCYTVT